VQALEHRVGQLAQPFRDQPSDEQDDEEEQQLGHEDRDRSQRVAERHAEVVEHRYLQVGGCPTAGMPVPTRPTPGPPELHTTG
jgi:hypothetical protein